MQKIARCYSKTALGAIQKLTIIITYIKYW